jgi:hypothetical protein
MKKKEKLSSELMLVKTPDCKTIYAVGAAGGFTPYDFRMQLYNKYIEIGEKQAAEVVAELVLSPFALKEFTEWMTKQLGEYERLNGPISPHKTPGIPKK